jgi:RNA polymerase sigma-70 factor (ECF subfamily)
MTKLFRYTRSGLVLLPYRAADALDGRPSSHYNYECIRGCMSSCTQGRGLLLLDFGGTLRAAQAGDGDAFACIWRQFQPGLLRFLTVKAAPAADDLAADVWLRITRALPSFEGDEQSFKAWLYTTARNRVTDWYRSGQRRLESVETAYFSAVPADSHVELEVAERSATDAAVALIAKLPAAQAEAVMLRIVAGLDVPRVAMVMGRSPGSVRVLCHRGLKMLERLLQDEGSAPLPTHVVDVAPVVEASTVESA